MTLNDPSLIDEIARLHDAYETALAANDLDTLNTSFWNSPHVVRYGVSEQLYGVEELRAYRQGHTPPFTDRRLARREICTFGEAVATVMSEIEMQIGGATRRSRQSQTWIRLPDVGWRIVAAHVSAPLPPGGPAGWGSYADVMAVKLGVALAAGHRPGVIANLERTAAIASGLLACELPDEAEPAPVFTA